MNKRGISPLIATVLILGFTVALAAIIMTWGTSFTRELQTTTEEQTTAQIACATDVAFDISCSCSDTNADNNIDQCKYRIINNEVSTITKIRSRFFNVNNVFLGTQQQTGTIADPFAVSGEFTISLSTTSPSGTGIRSEVLAEEVKVRGKTLSCGDVTLFKATCTT